MTKQFPSGQIKIRKAILVFLKHAGPPIVLYSDEPEELYLDLKSCIEKSSAAAPKLIERQAKGPVKTLAVLDTIIAGVAIQEESYV